VAISESHPLAAEDDAAIESLRGRAGGPSTPETQPPGSAQMIEFCRGHGFEARLAPPASDAGVATLLAASGNGLSLMPASMLNVLFPGVTYRKLRTQSDASMDLRCFYLRGERSPLLISLLATVRTFHRTWSA
jgi:DNA-binding transcriptional LysR family regulator